MSILANSSCSWLPSKYWAAAARQANYPAVQSGWRLQIRSPRIGSHAEMPKRPFSNCETRMLFCPDFIPGTSAGQVMFVTLSDLLVLCCKETPHLSVPDIILSIFDNL